MCNRYTIYTPAADMVARFEATQALFQPQINYNMAPTSTVPAMLIRDGANMLDGLRWGLVPYWAKDVKIGLQALNARSETPALQIRLP